MSSGTDALKAFIRLLAAHPGAALSGIAGLVLGLACALALLLFVRHESRYDAWLPQVDRLTILRTTFTLPGREPVEDPHAPWVALPLMQSAAPGIEAGTRLLQRQGTVQAGAAGSSLRALQLSIVDPNYFDVLRLPVAAGRIDANTLAQTDTLVLSRATAQRLFGRGDVVGELVELRIGPVAWTAQVKAVLADLPGPSHLVESTQAIVPFSERLFADAPDVLRNWSWPHSLTYLRLAPEADWRAVERQVRATQARHAEPDALAVTRLSLLPVRQMQAFPFPAHKHPADGGNLELLWALTGIAVLVLGVAGVNFCIVWIGLARERAQETALRRLFGAARHHLALRFAAEAAAVGLCALLLAVSLVEVARPALYGLFDRPLTPTTRADLALVAAGLGLVVVLLGAVAGWLAALAATSERLIDNLRGRRAGDGAQNWRQALMVFQFTAAVLLLACTGVVWQQSRHVASVDPGYQRAGLIVLPPTDPGEPRPVPKALRDEIAALPGVVSAGSTMVPPGGRYQWPVAVAPATEPDRRVALTRAPMDEHLPAVLGLRVLAGRALQAPDDIARPSQGEPRPTVPVRVMLDAAALPLLGLRSADAAIGQELRLGDDLRGLVVGVVGHLRWQADSRVRAAPNIYWLEPEWANTLIVRGDAAAPAQLLPALQAVWQRHLPTEVFAPRAVADTYEAASRPIRRALQLAGLGAGVAVGIALVGLWSMAAFVAARRRREMAVRKVLGASSVTLLRMLLLQLSRPVLIAVPIAWVIGWWAMARWLEGFSVRIDLSPLSFVVATAALLGCAWLAVVGEAWRAARARPVEALRCE